MLVAVTAMGDEESARRVREAGFDRHLVKPADPNQMLAVVGELWQAWSSAGETTRPGDGETQPRGQEPR